MQAKGFTIWLTGLPASGKSSLAKAIAEALVARGTSSEVIDSGLLRETLLGNTLGFTREDRDANCRRNAFVASLLARNGVAAVVSSISPYRATRNEIREELGNFVEVWVSTPKSVCIDRDQKGLWAKALAGEIRDFTGVDDPYEPPESPELELDLAEIDSQVGAEKVIGVLEKLGLI
jgi:adenylylsulfate kinase